MSVTSHAIIDEMFCDHASKFATSMKTLFNIMDDGGTGFVLLSDLEMWWEAGDFELAGSSQLAVLPSEILNALRNVTPANGRLDFENFMRGLRTVLMQHKQKNSEWSAHNRNRYPETKSDSYKAPIIYGRPPGGMLKAADKLQRSMSWNLTKDHNIYNGYRQVNIKQNNEQGTKDSKEKSPQDFNQLGSDSDDRESKHRVSRRHTLTNDVDYKFIPNVNLLQQQEKLLQEGLDALEIGRQWYFGQLQALTEEQKRSTLTAVPLDYFTSANKENIQLQTLRLLSLNQELKSLVNSSQKDLPVHTNLAKADIQSTPTFQNRDLEKLTLQYQRLVQELDEKSKTISKLEREKVILIKQMFEAKGRNNGFSSKTVTLI